MKKYLGLISIICLLIVLTGCTICRETVSYIAPPSTPGVVTLNQTILLTSTAKDPNAIICRQYSTSPFYSIVSNGNIILKINTNQKYPCVYVTGQQTAVVNTSVTIMNGVLTLSQNTRRNGFGRKVPQKPVVIEVDTRYLTGLTLLGSTYFASNNNLGANGINMTVGGNSTLNIATKKVVIGQLNASGNAKVSIYWIDSNFVSTNLSGNASVALAGLATNLNANLSGSSNLNAKYLRTKQAYIKTSGHSNATVFVLKSLSALAVDYSTIYYYPDPEVVGRYVACSGAVLRMAGLPY